MASHHTIILDFLSFLFVNFLTHVFSFWVGNWPQSGFKQTNCYCSGYVLALSEGICPELKINPGLCKNALTRKTKERVPLQGGPESCFLEEEVILLVNFCDNFCEGKKSYVPLEQGKLSCFNFIAHIHRMTCVLHLNKVYSNNLKVWISICKWCKPNNFFTIGSNSVFWVIRQVRIGAQGK